MNGIRFWAILILCAWGPLLCAETRLPKTQNPERTIVMELNKVPNSNAYDVNIRPLSQDATSPQQVHTTDENLRVQLAPGHYEMQTRSVDKKGISGSWGHWKDLWVRFRQGDVIFPKDDQDISATTTIMEKVTFEWPPVRGAKAYDIKIKDEKGKILKAARTKNSWISESLPVGSRYGWAIQPLSSMEETDVDEQPLRYHPFQVLHPSSGMRTVFFEVETKRNAIKYQFELVKYHSEVETTPPMILESKERNFRVRLHPGEYEMRVRSIGVSHLASQWSPPHHFYVGLYDAKAVIPEAHEVIDPDRPNMPIAFEWLPWKGFNTYELKVYNENEELVLREHTTENHFDATLPANHRYHWKVSAYLPRQFDRAPASVEYDAEGTNTLIIKKFVSLELNSPEEPAQWYGTSKYLTSDIKYQSANWDNGMGVSQDVLAGAADFGAGYWMRHSPFGFYGHGTFSAFTNDTGLTWGYPSGAIMGGYRHLFGDNSRLRVWMGPRYTEIPEIFPAFSGPTYAVSMVKSLGPELQVSFLHEINPKWGWHAFGDFYYSGVDAGTPSGLPQIPQLSYQVGLLGTYHFSPQYLAMLGYTYKAERAAYQTTDPSGRPNTIEYAGHYLNFILEFNMSHYEEADHK